MKKFRWLAGLTIVVLILLGVIYRQALVLRVTGMRPFVDERFDGWVEAGTDEEELNAVLRRIHNPLGSDPGSWVYPSTDLEVQERRRDGTVMSNPEEQTRHRKPRSGVGARGERTA